MVTKEDEKQENRKWGEKRKKKEEGEKQTIKTTM